MTSRNTPWSLATLIGIVLCTIPAAAQPENVTHVYDVMALTSRIADEEGPTLGFDEPLDMGAGISINSDGYDAQEVTTDALVTLIQANVEPEGWEGGRRISGGDGTLVVTAPPEVQAKVAAILAWIRAKQAALLTLEIAEYMGPAAEAETLLSGGSVLDPARAAALGRAPWTRERASRVIAYSGQRLNVARTNLQSYLSDYDTEVADSGHGWDPEVRTLVTGEVADATAVIADGGHGVMVEMRHTSCVPVLPMVTFETGLRMMTDKPLPPIDLPRTLQRKSRNAMWIPTGGQAISAATREGDTMRVVVVRHVHRPIELPPPPKGDGKRMVRVFDTRYSLYTAMDFRAPMLRTTMNSSGSGGVGGAIFDTGEEGARLSPEALVEVLQHDVDEDSWHNDRNRISIIGGQLVVHQTSETIALVDAYLAKLEHLRSLSLLVRSQVLVAADDATAEELLALVGEELAPAAKAGLLDRIAKGQGIEVTADLATAALPGQKVYAAGYQSEAYVKDYDIEIATKTAQLDPEVGVVRHGAVCSVRPTLIQSDGKVMLELRLERLALLPPGVREVGDGIKLVVPAFDGTARAVRVILVEGGTTLVDLGGRRFARIEVHVSRAAKKDGDK